MYSIKAVSFAIFVVTVLAYRQVSAAGQMCRNTGDCGFNENCTINTEVDAPCTWGICNCLAGFIADGNRFCQAIQSLKLNDSCSNFTYEALPANAFCNSSRVVVCLPEYSVSGNACVQIVQPGATGAPQINYLPEGAPCQRAEECLGDMQCGNGAQYICVCRPIYKRFDYAQQKCVRREYGDPCKRDTDCNVYTYPWHNWMKNFDGFNYREGLCVNQTCICSGNGVTTTRITILTDNNTLVTKTVCIVSGASFVKKGDPCTINPIGYGASTQTRVCEVGTVCYQCPENYPEDRKGTQVGVCRTFKNKTPIDLQEYIKNRVNIDPLVFGNNGGFDIFTQTTTTTTTLASSTIPVLRKNVGNPCSSDDACGTNEICNIAGNVDTPCNKGFCACKPCFAIDNQVNLCYPVVSRSLNDMCFNSQNEVLPANAKCYLNAVRCKSGFEPSPITGNCVRQHGVGDHGDFCTSGRECMEGLVCNMTYLMCLCPYDYQRYNNKTQSCVLREYGDPCSKEEDCRVPGQNWRGFTFASGTCYRGQCRCGQYNQKVLVGFLDEDSGVFRTKTICVSEAATLNIAKGNECSVDPVQYGQNPGTRVCSATNMCYQCPEDYDVLGQGSTGKGFCRAVSRAPPKPNCDAFLITTTLIPNFGI